jgi:hypothetical protein
MLGRIDQFPREYSTPKSAVGARRRFALPSSTDGDVEAHGRQETAFSSRAAGRRRETVMKKRVRAVTAAGLALLLQSSTAHAGGWHGYHGHGNCGGYYGYGHSSSDAAIIAATLFGTAAVVNALAAPQYAPPPVAYYPPPPVVYYSPPPVVYYAPPPVVYYPAPVAYYPPPPVYNPRPYYYPPR